MCKCICFLREIAPLQTHIIFSFIVVIASLLLASYEGTGEATITIRAGAQAGELVKLEPCIYEANKIKYEAGCDRLIVPENRNEPNSRLIALPVIGVHALRNATQGPIF